MLFTRQFRQQKPVDNTTWTTAYIHTYMFTYAHTILCSHLSLHHGSLHYHQMLTIIAPYDGPPTLNT